MEKEKKLYCVANAHLDTQWNWTVRDSIREYILNTLVMNFDLFEKYPSYVMNFEGAFRYRLAKEYYPDLYEKLKKYVAEGRWNTVGGAWDAMDVNVPSSEALMRQVLYGNNFFEKEFGKKSTDIFLADCFGFRYSLPSIARHMGLSGFSTQKLAWGSGTPIINPDGSVTKPLPDSRLTEELRSRRMDLGKWTGPDGNSVAVSLMEGNYVYNFDWNNDERPIGQRNEFLEQIEHNVKFAGVPVHSMYYGTGDRGGSCAESSAKMLEEAVRENGTGKNLFTVVPASTDSVFRDLTPEEYDALPNYDGELLIPHGSGTFTSHTINKRWNRKCELLADSAERASSAALVSLGYGYPADKLREAWETFLWHQFHDDLTGTSIMDAYVISYNDYIRALNMFAAELTSSAGELAGKISTMVRGTPVVVFNPSAFRRNEVVSADIKALGIEEGKYVRVYDGEGNEVPSQISRTADGIFVRFLADVRPVGVTSYGAEVSDAPYFGTTSLSVSEEGIENRFYSLKIDKNGDISSVYDKRNGRELLSAPVSLEIGPDTSTDWPSWELVMTDSQAEAEKVTGNVRIRVIENGPLSAAVEVCRTRGASEFRQVIRLDDAGERIDIEHRISWYEFASNLRAVFPLSVSNPKVSLDLGLGEIDSGNTDDPAYYQHVMHQWADLTDEDGSYGVSILNDCKYGIDKPSDDTLRVTLIHTPREPFAPESRQDWQDFGENIFTLSLLGHTGRRGEDTVREAEKLNQPLRAFRSERHDGNGSSSSFLSVSDGNVSVRCLKKEEKGDRLVLRLQETGGLGTENVRIRFGRDVSKVTESDGYETELGNGTVPCDNEGFSASFTKFQVRTFLIEFAPIRRAENRCVPLPLEYDTKVTTKQSDAGSCGFDGISIPEELWEDEIISSGTVFRMGPAGAANAVAAAGQTISLPEGTSRISVIASSLSGDRRAVFTAGADRHEIKVQSITEDVGCWTIVPINKKPVIKRAEIAYTFTHTHDGNGDRPYMFAYLFKYDITTDGASSITLPSDPDILVFAVTAETGRSGFVPALPLYDKVPDDGSKKHRLVITDISGNREEHLLACGDPFYVYTDNLYVDGVIFDHWEGDGIKYSNVSSALFIMPDHDTEVTAVKFVTGNDILLGKPASASHYMDDEHTPDKALDGNTATRWFATRPDGVLWLEVDAGDVYRVGKWLTVHGGICESNLQTTKNFELQYRISQDEEWKVADTVENNHTFITIRSFEPVEGRYFRLWIKTGTQHNYPWARIHMFQVFEV